MEIEILDNKLTNSFEDPLSNMELYNSEMAKTI